MLTFTDGQIVILVLGAIGVGVFLGALVSELRKRGRK